MKPYQLILSAAILLTACGKAPKTNTPATDTIAVTTAAVENGGRTTTLHFSGMLASSAESRPSFKIGGIISKIYVQEGDQVVKGQLLATLDLTEINAQVQQAQKAVEKAKRDLNRVKQLYNDTAATLEQYQNVTTQYEVATESLRIAQFNQQYAQIRATETGVVLKKIANEGELAGPGAPIFFISGNQQSDWVVRFGVSDKDWAVLKKGHKVQIELEAYPGKNFDGTISKTANAADPYSNTYEIEVRVNPAGQKLAVGLFSKISIQQAANTQANLRMIPVEAIVEGDGNQGFVYTISKNGYSVQKHKVQIAQIDNDKVIIASGLDGIAAVITGGVSYLNESSIIKLAKQ